MIEDEKAGSYISGQLSYVIELAVANLHLFYVTICVNINK